MKRNLMSLFLVFIATLFVFSLAGCETAGDETDTTTTTDDTVSTTGGAVGEPIEGAVSLDDDMVDSLKEYLRELPALQESDPISKTWEDKINEIKAGKQALLVEFDPDSYYYMCAYYSGDYTSEAVFYSNRSEYTWVKFDCAENIQEYYNDENLIAAFQVNKASLVTDILSDDASVPTIEHFQYYKPEFNDGYNIKDSVTYDKTFIYLNLSDKNHIYHSISIYDNELSTFPCIKLDGQYYLTKFLYDEYPDGTRDGEDILTYSFGQYYDALMNIADTETCRETDKTGKTAVEGLFEVNAFVDAVFK